MKTEAKLIACYQTSQGTQFEYVEPLFVENLTQRILQGDFGG